MIRLTCLCCALLPVTDLLYAEEAAGNGDGKAVVVQRFLMNPYHVNLGTIAKVKADGTLAVSSIANPRFILNRDARGTTDLSEGLYLGFVGKDFAETTTDTRLVSLRVLEVRPNGAALVKVSANTAKHIKQGEDLLIFRPPGATTAQLLAAPEYVKVDDGEKAAAPLGRGSVNIVAAMAASSNNLKQILIAMHIYHETYNHFPPAVVYGPDGKPWHSWRVLILPFIEQSNLYRQYRFDEPWNGPNNRKLLDRIPEPYRDPIYGAQQDNFYTNYVVISGKGTAFPTEGAKMKKKSDRPHANFENKITFRNITDGTSNTIMAGTVGPDSKIPWMKPENVVFSEKFPLPGGKGGFAAPYKYRGGSFGLFARIDGSVGKIASSVDLKTWHHLLQIADGNVIGDVPGPGSQARRSRRGKQPVHAVEIVRTKKGYAARLVAVPAK